MKYGLLPMRLALLFFGAITISLICASCDDSRQVADMSFDTKVADPAYVNAHPKALFDEAHDNIHTMTGRYRPFADLITNDGYRLTPNKTKFSPKTLEGYEILVIANALGANESEDNPAFNEAECDAVHDWVQAGGSLLLITDHYPTGSAAENLAKRFGVGMSKGMTFDSSCYDKTSNDDSQLEFSSDNGLLGDHMIIQGRDATERINRVVTFTGQSLEVPVNGAPLLKLSASAIDRAPSVRVEKSGGDTRVIVTYGEPVSASGRAQGVALELGKGRVVILGEAAMLTAQLDGKTKKPFGMNVSGLDNRQFALNIMRWLSRLSN